MILLRFEIKGLELSAVVVAVASKKETTIGIRKTTGTNRDVAPIKTTCVDRRSHTHSITKSTTGGSYEKMSRKVNS